jgi:hypothetical protein
MPRKGKEPGLNNEMEADENAVNWMRRKNAKNFKR